MKIFIGVVFVAAAVLAGCGKPTAQVPHIDDLLKPVVNGQSMTVGEFRTRYCRGENESNDICMKQRAAYNEAVTKTEMLDW